MIRFDCEKCGRIDESEFDGYAFGDRQLEGVMFVCSQPKKGQFKVRFKDDPKTDPYLVTLNTKYWLKAAKDYAKKNDIFTCPKVCGRNCS